jgi:(E)-4-hydroxy-3-methylbut-2-enyl-diphosphate synthase
MMVHTVRLLVADMEKEGLTYPLHLGVTEAGDGEDGRIKSAAGIGALLNDGIGDTIRVSLSEEPEFEIPVGRMLVDHIQSKINHPEIVAEEFPAYNRFEFVRRTTTAVGNIGGENVPVVIMNADGNYATVPDYLINNEEIMGQNGEKYPVFLSSQLHEIENASSEIVFVRVIYPALNNEIIALLKRKSNIVLMLSSAHPNAVGEMRALFHRLLIEGIDTPVILSGKYHFDSLQELQVKSAADLGVMFIDGFGDGILLENVSTEKTGISVEQVNSVAFGILQATRMRVTKTEFISCPSCGRTMFNLQTVIARIKVRTSHLKGLKIGIMGCIVNGPGEMADADYGYVGAGRAKVSLYKKKECIQRSIPEDEAVDRLIDLIKANGDWHD